MRLLFFHMSKQLIIVLSFSSLFKLKYTFPVYLGMFLKVSQSFRKLPKVSESSQGNFPNWKFPEFSNPNDTWNFSFSDWLSVCSKTISLQTRICTSDELEHIHGTHEIIVCWSESHHGDHQASIDLYMRLVIHMTRTTELPGKTMIVIATSKTHEKKTERGEVVI